jgi:RNA polymerase sigma factor (sigma-70 family)
MSPDEWLAAGFDEHRKHLSAVAYRMLGSQPDADDAVQEAWIRLSRSDSDAIENFGGWLTTVVARVSLDMLRSRTSRREDLSAAPIRASGIDPPDPGVEAELADSVGSALMVVLERLSPAERLAFVLHDTFAVPFDTIGTILDRSPNAAKQLANRARNKVRGAEVTGRVDLAKQREIVDAFLAASRGGDFDALVGLLDPDIVLDADRAAVEMGAAETTRGSANVAGMFSGRATAAQPCLIDGAVGIAWIVRGRPKVAWNLYMDEHRVVHVAMHADPETIDALAVVPLT